MRKIAFLISILFVISQANAQQAKQTPASTKTKWLTNTSIQFAYSQPDSASFAPELKTGNNWLFEYVYKAPENPDMTDDELTEVIGFQMKPIKSSSFTLKNEQLSKANAYFMLGCFCKERGFKKIHLGNISGKKINSKTWQLTISVKIEMENGIVTKNYKGNFSLSQN